MEQVHSLYARTRRESFERLRTRALSTFEHLTEQEIPEGFAAIETALNSGAGEEPVHEAEDLLVLRKPATLRQAAEPIGDR